MDLGKPTPSAGIIRVDFLPLRHNIPTPGVTYEARVAAVGPGGSTASTVSNGFSFQGACTIGLNPASQPMAGGGGSGSTGVTAPTGCAWTTVNNALSWLTITGGATGNGNGTVTYTAFANPTALPRSGTLTIGGQTFTVNQAGASCTFTVTPTAQNVLATGGTGSAGVTAIAGCAWTAVSNNTPWLTITGGANGNGDGTVSFSAAANPNTSPRTGTLTIAGRTFTVNQAALSCSYTLSADEPVGGGQRRNGHDERDDAGGVRMDGRQQQHVVADGDERRERHREWHGRFQRVVEPKHQPPHRHDRHRRADVLRESGCRGLHVRAGSGQSVGGGRRWDRVDVGDDTRRMCVDGRQQQHALADGDEWREWHRRRHGRLQRVGESRTDQRNGTLTIGGQTFTVTQAPAACSYTLSSASQAVAAGGGGGSTNVTAPTGCAWTGVSNGTPWLTVTSGANGSGNGTVAFNATANPNTSPRTGTLTIGGQTFSVNQAAAACTFSVSPASVAVASSLSSGSATVTSPTGCAWTGISNSTGWLSVTSGASGTGNGSVVFSATANGNATQRVGTLTVGGPDRDGDPGWRRVHVLDLFEQPLGDRRRGRGFDKRDVAVRLPVVCDHQR